MNFSDSFFKKIEKKTNVNKDTILELASKLQRGDMKDENNLLSILHVLQASGAMQTAIHADLVDHGDEGLGILTADEEVDE